jgi:hypothetical protein
MRKKKRMIQLNLRRALMILKMRSRLPEMKK